MGSGLDGATTMFVHDKKLTDSPAAFCLHQLVVTGGWEKLGVGRRGVAVVYKHNRWKIKFLKLLFKLAAYADTCMKYERWVQSHNSSRETEVESEMEYLRTFLYSKIYENYRFI